MKTCRVCNCEKPHELFSKNRTTKDGLQSDCKLCQKKRTAESRIKDPKKFLDYTRKWARKFRLENNISIGAFWSKNNPVRKKAYNKTHSLIISGSIIKPDKCEICKKESILESHHFDYNKPDLVIFLCKKCHCAIHGKESRSEVVYG